MPSNHSVCKLFVSITKKFFILVPNLKTATGTTLYSYDISNVFVF